MTAIRRWITFVIGALLLPLALVACGESSAGSVPELNGAEQLDSAQLRDEDIDELGFDVSNAESTAYRIEASLSDVFEYYGNEIQDDGWGVEDLIPDETEAILILSKDETIATVLMLEGYRAHEGRSLFEDEGLDINWEDVADDDRVILISSFICEEERVEDCLGNVLSQ